MSDTPKRRLVAHCVTKCGCSRHVDLQAPTATLQLHIGNGGYRLFERQRIVQETPDLMVFRYTEKRTVEGPPDE